MAPSALVVRRPLVRFPTTKDRRTWTPAAPPLACVADAVSLVMPALEPYVVRSVLNAVKQLEAGQAELAEEARRYAAQETTHHQLHSRYNETLAWARGVPALERFHRWTYARLGRRSTELGVSVAVGLEAFAFASARWIDQRADHLFQGADPERSSLFLWHLAEESEHRSSAQDVADGLGIRTAKRLQGVALAMTLLTLSALIGAIVFLAARRRLFNPFDWLRLIGWAISFTFVVVPMGWLSVLPSHHPSKWTDASSLTWWLSRYDSGTRRLPEWSAL